MGGWTKSVQATDLLQTVNPPDDKSFAKRPGVRQSSGAFYLNHRLTLQDAVLLENFPIVRAQRGIQTTPKELRHLAQGCAIPRALPWVFNFTLPVFNLFAGPVPVWVLILGVLMNDKIELWKSFLASLLCG
jgi:hypothetical protein